MGVAGIVTETIPKILDPLPGGRHLVNGIEFIVGWARANSLWPLVYGTACCAMEMMATGASRHDWARFGVEVARATPRQADLIVLAGTIVEKMGNNLVTLYQQMPGPKYVIAMGSCSISGGPFYYDSYSIVRGGDRLIPVDVYVPGCPPRPEALLYGIMHLQKLIRKEGRHNPWKVKEFETPPCIDIHSNSKKEWVEIETQKQAGMTTARERFKAENPDYVPYKAVRRPKDKFPEVPRRPVVQSGLANQDIYAIVHEVFPEVKQVKQENTDAENDKKLTSETLLEFAVTKDHYLSLLTLLKTHATLQMDLLLQVTAIDQHDFFHILVHLLSTRHGHKIFVRCPVAGEQPEIETLSHLYRGAEWHEREVYDLFGIIFRGHPDLRRLFLKEDFPGHPLRKNFKDPSRIVKRPY